MRRVVALFLVLTLIQPGCARNRSQASNIEGSSWTQEEIEIGNEIHNTILASFHPYTYPKVTDYVRGVGEKLTQVTKNKKLSYQFIVLYNDKIYATSAPGGRVYLTTGMLYFLENEAQMAAVISHELAQLQYRDGKFYHPRKVVEKVTEVGIMIGGLFGSIGVLAAMGFAVIHSLVTAGKDDKTGRLLKSDKNALGYMLEADYDPQAMMDFYGKMIAAPEEIQPYFFDYFKSRPITSERYQALQKQFAKLPLEGRELFTHWESYQVATKGVREMYSV